MPNTRAFPPLGRAIPSRILMVVVLPAPFRPRKPKIDPAGTRRSSPRRASVASYRFWRPVASMASVSATGCSFGPRGSAPWSGTDSCEFGLEETTDFLICEAARAQLVDGAGHDHF